MPRNTSASSRRAIRSASQEPYLSAHLEEHHSTGPDRFILPRQDESYRNKECVSGMDNRHVTRMSHLMALMQRLTDDQIDGLILQAESFQRENERANGSLQTGRVMIDRDEIVAVRAQLRRIPGAPIVEDERHGKDTAHHHHHPSPTMGTDANNMSIGVAHVPVMKSPRATVGRRTDGAKIMVEVGHTGIRTRSDRLSELRSKVRAVRKRLSREPQPLAPLENSVGWTESGASVETLDKTAYEWAPTE